MGVRHTIKVKVKSESLSERKAQSILKDNSNFSFQFKQRWFDDSYI